MSITNVGQPQQWTPGFNEVNYYVDSTNKNKVGFRYVVDLYNGVGVKIDEFRVAPRPVDGYGEIKLQSRLSKYLSYDDRIDSASLNSPKSYFEYSVRVGEEYTIIDNLNASLNYFNTGGFVTITTVNAATYSVNDIVVLNDPTTFNGVIATITSVVSSTQFVVSIVWNAAYSVSQSGSIQYADSRPIVTRDLFVYSNRVVFNSAYTFKDFINYDQSKIVLTLSDITGEMLTTLPVYGFTVKTGQELWLMAATNSLEDVYAHFVTSDGSEFKKLITPVEGQVVTRFGAGSGNAGLLTLVSGTFPFIKSTTEWYEVDLRAADGAELTQLYHIDIDRRCGISDVTLSFIDRRGSEGTIVMQGRTYENINVTRETYKQRLGGLSGGSYTYATTDRGTSVISSSQTETIDLNSYPMSEAMRDYVLESVASPGVKVKMGGEWFSAEVVDVQKDKVRRVNTPVLTLKMTVRIANESNVNV